jgi:hypothetical protein
VLVLLVKHDNKRFAQMSNVARILLVQTQHQQAQHHQHNISGSRNPSTGGANSKQKVPFFVTTCARALMNLLLRECEQLLAKADRPSARGSASLLKVVSALVASLRKTTNLRCTVSWSQT